MIITERHEIIGACDVPIIGLPNRLHIIGLHVVLIDFPESGNKCYVGFLQPNGKVKLYTDWQHLAWMFARTGFQFDSFLIDSRCIKVTL